MKKRFKIGLIIIIIISLIVLFFKKSYNLSSTILEYAKIDAESKIIEIINNKIKILENEEIYNVVRNNVGEIEMIDYNSATLNKAIQKISQSISSEIDKKFKKNTISIPLGVITKNPILSNYGPNLKVKIKALGESKASVKVNVKDYGINNALIEVVLIIQTKVKIILPIISDDIVISQEIPISYKIINAKVPDYFSTYYPNNWLNIKKLIYFKCDGYERVHNQ